MKGIAITPGSKNSVAMLDVPDPPVGEQDVLVRVVRVGVCGTDREIIEGMYGTAPPGSDYLVIGHEALGRVLETGPRVTGFATGDYVVASVRRPCPHERCLPCRSDQNDMCVTGDYVERGISSRHGFLSEYYIEDQRYLTRVPGEIEEIGILLEPLSVVEKAMRQTFEIQERLPWQIESAAIMGGGTIGILGAMLLRLEGIDTYVLDLSETGGFKSRLISQLGAHHIDTRTMTVSEAFAGIGRVDFVLEATGYSPLVFDAFRHLANNGVLCLVGVSGGTRSIDMDANDFNNSLVMGNRLVFGSVNAGPVDFQSGVGHIQLISRRWPGVLQSMVTKRLQFSQYKAAFQRQPDDIKVVIEMDSSA